MHQDNIQRDTVKGKTYRTFEAWQSWGFRIKKGEKSTHEHSIFGNMFSEDQVYNPWNLNREVGKDLNYLSKYGDV